jgi:hypothetical protein
MRKLLFTLLFCCPFIANCCGGYIPEPRYWSAGIILLGTSSYGATGSWVNAFPGLVVKHYREKVNLRFGIEHYVHYEANNNIFSIPDYLSVNGFEKQNMVRMGIEKTIKKWGRFRPFIAGDIGFVNSKSEYSYQGGIAVLNEIRNISKVGGTIIGSAGFEWMVLKHVSIAAETRARLSLLSRNQKTIYVAGNIDSRPTSDFVADFDWKPVGIVSVNFHF